MTNLIGRYHFDKSNLVKPDLHLVIGTRRKPSLTKPKHYLLIKSGKDFLYLSSIYPFDQDMPEKVTDAQIFSLDFQGATYLLTLKTVEKQAQITILETGRNATIPHKGGGADSTCP